MTGAEKLPPSSFAEVGNPGCVLADEKRFQISRVSARWCQGGPHPFVSCLNDPEVVTGIRQYLVRAAGSSRVIGLAGRHRVGAGSRKKQVFRGYSEARACPSPGFRASLACWPLLVSGTPQAPAALLACVRRADRLGSIESRWRRGPEQSFWRS